MRYILIGISVVLAIIFFSSGFTMKQTEPVVDSAFKIGGIPLEIELADTKAKHILGLAGRESLPENAGMLFVYDSPGNPGIWMKDMNFSIDIIWLNEDREVVEITRDVSPDTYPTVFHSQAQIQYILEVNAGWAAEHKIELNAHISL